MKKFIYIFIISIIASGIFLIITYLLSFTPLDPVNRNFLSNGFISGIILMLIGFFQMKPTQYTGEWHSGEREVNNIRYGNFQTGTINIEISTHGETGKKEITIAAALIISGIINLIISFF